MGYYGGGGGCGCQPSPPSCPGYGCDNSFLVFLILILLLLGRPY